MGVSGPSLLIESSESMIVLYIYSTVLQIYSEIFVRIIISLFHVKISIIMTGPYNVHVCT